jgi:replicative DNA helicase
MTDTDRDTSIDIDLERAEEAVLGSMLRDNGCIADVVQHLRPEDFRRDANRKVFAAEVELFRRGQPVDEITVSNLLRERGHLLDVGYPYIGRLHDASPTAANADYYTGIVRDASLLRQLRDAALEICADADRRRLPSEELLEQAERRIFAIAQVGAEGKTVDLRTVVGKCYDRLDARQARGGRTVGLSTGFLDLDEVTAGLQDSELVVVGARPSVGKTTMGLSLALNVARQGAPVFFVSMEQSDVELGDRLLCSEAGLNAQRLRRGTLSKEEVQRFRDAGDRLAVLPLHIDQEPRQGMFRIVASARRLKLRHGIRLVVLDYLQLVEPDNPREPRHIQVGAVSRRLKQLARDLAVPVVALAQVNRAAEDRQGQRPRLSDLRESGSIEADADTVLLLHRPEPQSGALEVEVAKQRNGPTDLVTLAFRRDCQRLENFAPDVS